MTRPLDRYWIVRHHNGNEETFHSLQAVRAAIGAGRLMASDDIYGRGGWRKLAEVPELQSAFWNSSSGEPTFDVAALGALPPLADTQTVDPHAAKTDGTGVLSEADLEAAAPAEPPVTTPPPVPRMARPAVLPPAPLSRPSAGPVSWPSSARAMASAFPPHAPTPAVEMRASAPPLSDVPPRPTPARGPSAGGRMFAGLVLGGALVAAGWWWWNSRPSLASERADALVAHGEERLLLDREEAYQQALELFTKASAFGDRHLGALVGLSRAHAGLAQLLRFQIADRSDKALTDPETRGELKRMETEAVRHAAAALDHALRATRLAPNDAAALVAACDAERLNGEPDIAERYCARANTLGTPASGEAHRVGALLTAERAAGDLAVAKDLAELAVDGMPNSTAARLLLARADLAAGKTAEARVQVDAILSRDVSHPSALSLRERLGAQGEPNMVAEASPEVGAFAPTPEPPQPATEAVTNTTTIREIQIPTGDGRRRGRAHAGRSRAGRTRSPRGPDAAQTLEQAYAALEQGQYGDARRLFERAGAEGNRTEADAGLGEVALAEGNLDQARRLLRRATARGYAEALIPLAHAEEKSGHSAEAAHAYRGYLMSLPNGVHANEAQSRLSALDPSSTMGGGQTATTDIPSSPGRRAPRTPANMLPAPTSVTTTRSVPNADRPAVGTEYRDAKSRSAAERSYDRSITNLFAPVPARPPARAPRAARTEASAPPGAASPSTPANALPLPKGWTSEEPPPSSDTPAVGSEYGSRRRRQRR